MLMKSALNKSKLVMVRRPVYVQYTSNLFVDEYEKLTPAFYIKPVAPILSLNGNIGKVGSSQLWSFLHHCSRNWDQTLYVPGPLELAGNVNTLRDTCNSFGNVKLLNRDTYTWNRGNTIFAGATLKDGYGASILDKLWLLNEFETWKMSSSKIVALSCGTPHHAFSMDFPLNSIEICDFYPVFNAWITGGIGGKQIVFRNNVLGAVNGRGSLIGMKRGPPKGWSTGARIRIPENHEIDEGFTGVY